MPDSSTIVELQRRSEAGIFAVPYRGGRRRKALRLADGAIVETPTPEQRSQAPDRIDGSIAVAVDGKPATIHHANLGLIADFLALEGVFFLPSGDVAAVYGAQALPIGLSMADAAGGEFVSIDDRP